MTLHTYGDSFTAGVGTRIPLRNENDKALKVPNPKRYKFWVDNIASKFTALTINNRGVGGISNELIFTKFLADLSKFKKGDLIIYCIGFPERSDFITATATRELLDPKENQINTPGRPLYCFTTSIPRPDSLLGAAQEVKDIDMTYVGAPPLDMTVAMMNYNAHYKAPNDKYERDNHRFKVQLVLDYLKKKGVRSYIWDLPPIAGNFEKITEATKGKIDDHHWSWKGNQDFSKWLLTKLKKAI